MREPGTSEAVAAPPAGFSPLDRWFRPVRVPRDAPRELADLAARGSVVFVVRSAGLLNFLYLVWLVRQLRLPPLRVAVGLGAILAWLARVRRAPSALLAAARAGETSIVFLQGHPVSGAGDPFTVLAAAQRELDRPIFLVPALLVWARRPQKVKPTVGELLLGTPDAPSSLANALGFVVNHRRAVLRLGAAFDLQESRRARPGVADAVVGRVARGALHLHLARETRAAVGPPLRSAARTRERVLRDRGLRRTLEEEARARGVPLAGLEAEAARDVAEIAARYSAGFVELVRPWLAWLFGRLYDAVDVDEEGLARVKRAMAEAPVVLCPSHKSHIDYLVLSWLFYEHGMPPPHVAAGINLAFWPFGAIARRGGAFFIRRTVKGDRVYTAALRAYVKLLQRDGFPQEFYLEGGRSRTGKLLIPRTGLFSMEVDAWLDHPGSDVLFVPVAIDYERLMEGRAYAAELAGGEKQKEDLGGLLRAGKVLGRRYGRLTVQFGAPVSLRWFAGERLGADARALAPEGEPAAAELAVSRKGLVQALANHVAYGINDAVTVTPVGLLATALLAHLRRGVGADELAGRVRLLRELAAEDGARFARGMAGAPDDPRQGGPLAAGVARLVEDGLVRVEEAAGETVYQAVDERRPLLDFHKNAVIHRWVPLALVAAALRGLGEAAPEERLREDALALSRLLKLEFLYRVGVPFDELFQEALRRLERRGALVRAGDEVRAGPERGHLEFLAATLRPFLEGYAVALRSLRGAADRPQDAKGLVRGALEAGRAAHAAGRIALREAVSKATMENAVEWAVQVGALADAGEGRLRLDASWAAGPMTHWLAVLDRHLRL